MERIEQLTYRWLDGAITPDEAAELESLTAAEPAARARHYALLRLETVLRGLGPAPDIAAAMLEQVQRESSTDLERSVMQTIGSLPAPGWSQAASGDVSGKRSRRTAIFAFAASMLLAGSIGGWWNLQRTAEQNRLPSIVTATETVAVVNRDGRPRSQVMPIKIEHGGSDTL